MRTVFTVSFLIPFVVVFVVVSFDQERLIYYLAGSRFHRSSILQYSRCAIRSYNNVISYAVLGFCTWCGFSFGNLKFGTPRPTSFVAAVDNWRLRPNNDHPGHNVQVGLNSFVSKSLSRTLRSFFLSFILNSFFRDRAGSLVGIQRSIEYLDAWMNARASPPLVVCILLAETAFDDSTSSIEHAEKQVRRTWKRL